VPQRLVFEKRGNASAKRFPVIQDLDRVLDESKVGLLGSADDESERGGALRNPRAPTLNLAIEPQRAKAIVGPYLHSLQRFLEQAR
jgi:hypothetical protein